MTDSVRHLVYKCTLSNIYNTLYPLGATRHLFTPAEKRIPRVRIETRQSDILASQRILVALDSWPRNSRYPLGHFVRALGPIGEIYENILLFAISYIVRLCYELLRFFFTLFFVNFGMQQKLLSSIHFYEN